MQLPTLQSSSQLQGRHGRHFRKTLFIFCPPGKFIRGATHAKCIMQMKPPHLELSFFSYSSEHECIRLLFLPFAFLFSLGCLPSCIPRAPLWDGGRMAEAARRPLQPRLRSPQSSTGVELMGAWLLYSTAALVQAAPAHCSRVMNSCRAGTMQGSERRGCWQLGKCPLIPVLAPGTRGG